MKSNSFGLDIGTTTMKVVWLSRDKEATSYESALIVPTPQQGMQSESPFDHQEIAKQINKLMTDAKINVDTVAVALPESHVFTRVIDMPVLSEKELATAIYWEAEQYIPVPLDTMSLDWSVLRRPADVQPDPKMQVLLVAAPLQLIKRYQSILELAGLTISSIETDILATIRGIVANTKLPASLLLNIGARNTLLSIIQNGILVFAYTIPLGGIAMTRAIAADFGFSLEQAEEYKKAYGLSDKNFGGKVGAAIEPIFMSILTEVKKAVAFYSEKYKNDSPLTQALFTGGGASLPGIDLYFAQNLGIEAVIANPWKLLNIQSVPRSVEVKGPEYTVAIGLALKEYE